MKKKLAAIAGVLALAAVLVWTGTNSQVEAKTKKTTKKTVTTTKTTEPETEADGKVSEEDFAVKINDVKITFGEDINDYLDELGEADSYTEARSCLYDGYDKVYEYGGITLYTYPSGKKDIVYIAEYNGEESTLSGIRIGSTKKEVLAAYGEDYAEDTLYLTYEYGENAATISFQFENDKVSYIEIYNE